MTISCSSCTFLEVQLWNFDCIFVCSSFIHFPYVLHALSQNHCINILLSAHTFLPLSHGIGPRIMLYNQTNDILYVKDFLGHKNIDCTMIYIQLYRALFMGKTTSQLQNRKNGKKVQAIVEKGLRFLCDMNNTKFFRKRKQKVNQTN